MISEYKELIFNIIYQLAHMATLLISYDNSYIE